MKIKNRVFSTKDLILEYHFLFSTFFIRPCMHCTHMFITTLPWTQVTECNRNQIACDPGVDLNDSIICLVFYRHCLWSTKNSVNRLATLMKDIQANGDGSNQSITMWNQKNENKHSDVINHLALCVMSWIEFIRNGYPGRNVNLFNVNLFFFSSVERHLEFWVKVIFTLVYTICIAKIHQLPAKARAFDLFDIKGNDFWSNTIWLQSNTAKKNNK